MTQSIEKVFQICILNSAHDGVEIMKVIFNFLELKAKLVTQYLMYVHETLSLSYNKRMLSESKFQCIARRTKLIHEVINDLNNNAWQNKNLAV